jgi:PAS domain S-box-containing protein
MGEALERRMRVLLVGASTESAGRLRAALADDTVATADGMASAAERLAEGVWDLIVLGDALSREAMAAACGRLEADAELADVPRLALASEEAIGLAMIEAGATDALVWPRDADQLPLRLAAARRTRRELARSTTARLLMSEAPDGLYLADAEGRFVDANAAGLALLGYTREELLRLRVADVIPGGDQEEQPLALDQVRAGKDVLRERRMIRKDGRRVHVENHVRRLSDGSFLCVTRVVDARKARERELILGDRLAALATLAAGLSHELNNPLSYVLANLEVLRDQVGAQVPDLDPRLAEDVRRLLHEMTEGARRVADIVRELRTFARADDEVVGPVDVHRLLGSALAIAASEIKRRARLIRDFQPIPRVRANHARLGQVIVNLIVNAIQSLPEGEPDRYEVRVSTYTDAEGRAVIEVADTGLGIPPGARDRIFDPFFTTRGDGIGTGLGLSVCHGIVHALGGEITVDSDVGQGATFRVALPPEAPPAVAGADTPPPQRRSRVLVVDDEVGVGRALQRILRHHESVVATSGQQALDLLETGGFDAVFCDLNLPDLDGLEVFDRACALDPGLARRFAFLTGGVLPAPVAERILRAGAPVLEKPFSIQEVRDLADRLVSRRQVLDA